MFKGLHRRKEGRFKQKFWLFITVVEKKKSQLEIKKFGVNFLLFFSFLKIKNNK